MHKTLFAQQYFFGLFVIFIGHTTIYRTNGSTLWLIVKTLTLCALIGSDKIYLI
jgi:hypothetical protein